MAGAVHLVNQEDTAAKARTPVARWFDTAIFVCLAAVAPCAPLSTKGAVNAFRAATLIWVISLLVRKRRLVPQPLALPLLLFLALTAFSSAFSVDPLLSWGRMRTVSLLVLAIVIGQCIHSLRHLKLLAALLVGSGLLTVIYTGWQYTAGIGVQAVGSASALAPLGHFGLAHGEILRKVNGRTVRSGNNLRGSHLPSGSIDLLLWRETPNALQPFHVMADGKALQSALRSPGITLVRAHPPRAQGFFKHYFPFSEILVFIGLLLWGFAVSGVPNPTLRAGFIVAFLLTTVTLALTLTRISLAGLLLGVLLIEIVGGTRRIKWLSLAGVLIIAMAGLYWVQRHRAAPESDPGTEYRLLMWRDSVKMIRAHPLLGVGFDSVAGDWQRWNLEAYRRFGLHSHFHSTPIQLAVECGIPALGVWIWLIVTYAIFLLRLHKTAARADNWFGRALVLGALGGLAGFVLTGFLQYNFGDAEAMVIFWFIMGMTFALNSLLGKDSETVA